MGICMNPGTEQEVEYLRLKQATERIMPMSRSIRKLSQAAAIVTVPALGLPALAETRSPVANPNTAVVGSDLVVPHLWVWSDKGTDDPDWQAATVAIASAMGLPDLADTRFTTPPDSGVSTRDLRMTGTELQGEIVNNTDTTIISAELVVRHRWRWANETEPGTNDPSWIDTYPLDVTVPPGGSAPFKVEATREHPQRSDGSFQTDAFVRRFKTIPSG